MYRRGAFCTYDRVFYLLTIIFCMFYPKKQIWVFKKNSILHILKRCWAGSIIQTIIYANSKKFEVKTIFKQSHKHFLHYDLSARWRKKLVIWMNDVIFTRASSAGYYEINVWHIFRWKEYKIWTQQQGFLYN